MKKVFSYFMLILCLLLSCSCSSDKKETINLGTVKKETIEDMVTKYNKVILDSSGLDPVKIDTMNYDNNMYSYDITEGIYLVIIPLDDTNNITEDIVNSMRIYVKKDYKDDPQVLAYAKMLVVANNGEITNEEARRLIDKAVLLSGQKLTSNNGKGISVGYLKTEDHFEYQVIRNYE